jgi:hypothetical protein
MAILRITRISGVITLLITIFSLSLPAYAKYSGGTGDPNDPYQIATAEDLILLGETPEDYDKHFILTADIDLDPNLPGRKVFDRAVVAPDTNDVESGHQGTSFSGIFDGKGHTISRLTIIGVEYLGLFGSAVGGEIRNLGVVDVNITGSGDHVGGLVGRSGDMENCYSTGSVSGTWSVGGLVGEGGHLRNCYSTVAVSGDNCFGGLVGDAGNIENCYSTGTVRGLYSVGGLVGGWSRSSTIQQSFWNNETSVRTESYHGDKGLTTSEMQDIQTYLDAGWDFVGEIENGTHEIWQMPEGGGYPVLSVFNGYTPPKLQGLGTPDDPYLIYDAMDLGAIYYYSRSACYRLGASIDLSGIRWSTAVIPSFEGIFDGNNLNISHLTISGGCDLGLFGQLKSRAEVMDLGVVDVYIKSLHKCGGLAYYNGGCVIRCYASGTVSSVEYSVGGLVGYNNGTINQSYSNVIVISGDWSSDVGGLAGHNMGEIENCYSRSLVRGHSGGGLVGYNRDGSITNCYSIGPDISVSGGGLVGWGDPVNVSNNFWNVQTSCQTTSYGGVGKTTAEMQTASTFLEAGWDFVGETANGTDDIWWILEGKDYPHLWWEEPTAPYGGGSGEPNDPYQIATAEDLMLLGRCPWDYGKHFILTADIDLNPNLFSYMIFGDAIIAPNPLPYFTGVFDGNGHTISNLTVELFGYLGSGAEVRDLGVVDVNISSGYYYDVYVGGLSGDNGGSITNCYSTGVISGNRYVYVGGLVGTNSGNITVCYSTCMVDGDKYMGGLVGENDVFGSITNCYSTGKISGDELVGGLVGSNYGNVIQCHSIGSVSGTSSIGGLVGINHVDVIHCYSTGMVSATGYAISDIGGLIGNNSGDVTQCYSTGTVNATSELLTLCVGGLVGGGNNGNVIQCYSTGTVSVTGQFTVGIGGLAGIGSTVTQSVWDIETSGLSESAGGTGKTTVEMQTARTFLDVGWDFVDETENGTDDIWWIDEGNDYPRLWWEIGDETSP